MLDEEATNLIFSGMIVHCLYRLLNRNLCVCMNSGHLN